MGERIANYSLAQIAVLLILYDSKGSPIRFSIYYGPSLFGCVTITVRLYLGAYTPQHPHRWPLTSLRIHDTHQMYLVLMGIQISNKRRGALRNRYGSGGGKIKHVGRSAHFICHGGRVSFYQSYCALFLVTLPVHSFILVRKRSETAHPAIKTIK